MILPWDNNMNNDIDSLMDNGDYQGILDLLKYEKVKSKIL